MKLRRPPLSPADAQLRDAAARIRHEVNRGNLGVAAVILRGYPIADRDRIIELLERRRHPRGQALVEFALVSPLMLLVALGGVWFGLWMLQTARYDHAAREAAYAAAGAGAEDSACLAALDALRAITGASYAACDGSDSVQMAYAPADSPPTVTIVVTSYLPVPPPLDALADGEVTGKGTALLRSPEPSPAP